MKISSEEIRFDNRVISTRTVTRVWAGVKYWFFIGDRICGAKFVSTTKSAVNLLGNMQNMFAQKISIHHFYQGVNWGLNIGSPSGDRIGGAWEIIFIITERQYEDIERRQHEIRIAVVQLPRSPKQMS